MSNARYVNIIKVTSVPFLNFTRVGLFSLPDEKRAQSKLPATQAQKLGYAYNRKRSKVAKTVQIMSVSITELIWQSKTFFSFLFNSITVSIDLGVKLQFLCLPLDVNSL